jgi:AmmeMemoRadiSam system protein A
MPTTKCNKIILDLVKTVISDKLNNTISVNKEQLIKDCPLLDENKATFINLFIDGEFRGSQGTLVAHLKLFDDLCLNAAKVAFNDPHFPPITNEELEKLEIEVSILSPQLEIKYSSISDLKSKIDIGRDGVFIRQEDKKATFLPQVWNELPDFEDYLSHLFYQAGITSIEKPIDVFVYQTETIKL